MQPYLATPGEVLLGKGAAVNLLYILVQGRVRSTDYDGTRTKAATTSLLPPGALVSSIKGGCIDAPAGEGNCGATQSPTRTRTVVAHSHAHLFILDLESCARTRQFLQKQGCPLMERYPPLLGYVGAHIDEAWPKSMRPSSESGPSQVAPGDGGTCQKDDQCHGDNSFAPFAQHVFYSGSELSGSNPGKPTMPSLSGTGFCCGIFARRKSVHPSEGDAPWYPRRAEGRAEGLGASQQGPFLPSGGGR